MLECLLNYLLYESLAYFRIQTYNLLVKSHTIYHWATLRQNTSFEVSSSRARKFVWRHLRWRILSWREWVKFFSLSPFRLDLFWPINNFNTTLDTLHYFASVRVTALLPPLSFFLENSEFTILLFSWSIIKLGLGYRWCWHGWKLKYWCFRTFNTLTLELHYALKASMQG